MKTPSLYPSPEHTFAGYPTSFLDDSENLVASSDAAARLLTLLDTPLTHYSGDRRVVEPAVLSPLLETATSPTRSSELIKKLEAAGSSPRAARATIAWLLKYDLLHMVH